MSSGSLAADATVLRSLRSNHSSRAMRPCRPDCRPISQPFSAPGPTRRPNAAERTFDVTLDRRLRQVFVVTLDLDDEMVVESLKYQDIPEWDSIGHMSLVVAIEDEFDVQLDTDQVIDM